MTFHKGQKNYAIYFFFEKIKFEISGKTSMISSKHVLMKNSQLSLHGSKHLLALQTIIVTVS